MRQLMLAVLVLALSVPALAAVDAPVPIRKPTQHEIDKARGRALLARTLTVLRWLNAMTRSGEGPCLLIFEDDDPTNFNFNYDCERSVVLCDVIPCDEE